MKPNFLLIISDDCTYNDLPLYGGKNARTPNLSNLAEQGLVFNHAHLAMAMCQPCRAELYTGQYPMRNGCAWNHSASRPDVTGMPQHLAAEGYRIGIAGKIHVKPDAAYPFELVDGFDRDCCRNPTLPHDVAGIREFMERRADEPFCLVVGLVDPHVPWVMGDPSRYPPENLKLPPNIADTPQTREDFSRYLAEITYMDGQVGDILDTLDAVGRMDDTLVLFTSEQGSQFPGAKWTNWNLGLHTALIARWPGHIAPGGRTDALVQYADVLPTLLAAAGGDPSHYGYDGSSFLNVLSGKTDSHRDFTYGMHNNIPEGPPYPIRTISDGRYRYIRNLTPNELYIERHVMGRRIDAAEHCPYWHTWAWAAGDDTRIYEQLKRYMLRPPEELYDSMEDPYEWNNRIDDPASAAVKARLCTELDRWLSDQGDPGIPQDTREAHSAARRGEHLYGPAPTQKGSVI